MKRRLRVVPAVPSAPATRGTRAAACCAGAAAAFGLGALLALGCSPRETPPPSPAESREAVLDALSDPDTFGRARRLATLLPKLGAEHVPEIRTVLEDPDVDGGAAETLLLVRFWATHDPAGASAWAATLAPRAFRYAATLPSFELWARRDPEAARTWIGAHLVRSGPSREAAQTGLVRGWFDSGQPGLVQSIEGLGKGFEQQRLLGVLAQAMIQRDGGSATTQWAESLPDEPKPFKLAAFRQVGSTLAQADLAAAVAWCDAHCGGPFGSSLRQLVAARWARQDAPAAMDWLAAAPEGSERDRAVRVASQSWLRRDREAALRWIEAIGPDDVEPWLRPALDLYAVAISRERAAEAVDWAAHIDDETRRQSAYVAIARRWREQDAAAADAWLAESPLSEEARQMALRPARPARPPRR